jgi:restriction system protein
VKKKRKYSDNILIAIVLFALAVFLITQSAVVKFLIFFFIVIALAVATVLKFYPRFAEKNKFRNFEMDDVDNMPGKAFEQYVAELMTYRGFQTELTKSSGDFGVDIIAQSGKNRYAVQCKRYSKSISGTAVSDAVGGLKSYNCQIPVVVTNQYFTKGAKEVARVNRCVLIDRDSLSEWINDFRNEREVQRLLK